MHKLLTVLHLLLLFSELCYCDRLLVLCTDSYLHSVWFNLHFIQFFPLLFTSFSLFLPFLSSALISSPPHLHSIHTSSALPLHTFSCPTYLSEQIQNALQRCCEGYLPLLHTSLPASWT